MNKGKKKCELLKEIRKKIAEANGIEYDPPECTHEGDCSGSCPRCDDEAEYIIDKIRSLESEGESVKLEGVVTNSELEKDWDEMHSNNGRLGGIPAYDTTFPDKAEPKKKKRLFNKLRTKIEDNIMKALSDVFSE